MPGEDAGGAQKHPELQNSVCTQPIWPKPICDAKNLHCPHGGSVVVGFPQLGMPVVVVPVVPVVVLQLHIFLPSQH